MRFRKPSRRCYLAISELENRLAPASSNTLVSRAEPSLAGDTASGPSYIAYQPTLGSAPRVGKTISDDGRFVVVNSLARNMVPGQVDTNSAYDLFLFDRVTNTTQLISATAGSPSTTADGESSLATISADGRYVAYSSTATNLITGFVPAPANKTNVYRYDRVTQQNLLVSHRFDSASTSAPTDDAYLIKAIPLISSNGQFIAFQSNSPDLIAGFPNFGSNHFHVFLYDANTDKTSSVNHVFGNTAMPSSGASLESMTPDGRYITFFSNSTDLLSTPTTSKGDVYRYDRLTGNNILISRASNVAPFGGNGRSVVSDISADGRWVAFSTKATNLVPGATMSGTQIVLADAETGTIKLVSRSAASALVGADQSSIYSRISADGQVVTYQSLASNLIAGFVNNAGTSLAEFVYADDRMTVTGFKFLYQGL